MDPQRPGQPVQGWLILLGGLVMFAGIVLLAIWASHHG